MLKTQGNRTGQRCCCRFFFYFVVTSKLCDKIGTQILKCAIVRYNYNMKRFDSKTTIRENVLWKLSMINVHSDIV